MSDLKLLPPPEKMSALSDYKVTETHTFYYTVPDVSYAQVRAGVHWVLNVLPAIGEPVLTKHEFRL